MYAPPPDHFMMIIIPTKGEQRKSRPFKFKSMWMRHEETIHLGDLESGAVKEPYREF